MVRATGPPGHRATGPPGYRATGPPGHRAIGPPGHRAIGPPGHRATGPPGHRATGPPAPLGLALPCGWACGAGAQCRDYITYISTAALLRLQSPVPVSSSTKGTLSP